MGKHPYNRKATAQRARDWQGRKREVKSGWHRSGAPGSCATSRAEAQSTYESSALENIRCRKLELVRTAHNVPGSVGRAWTHIQGTHAGPEDPPSSTSERNARLVPAIGRANQEGSGTGKCLHGLVAQGVFFHPRGKTRTADEASCSGCGDFSHRFPVRR